MHPVKTGLVAGLYFGGFQALMPTLGYICGGTIRQYIEAVSKYVALFLLCIIGMPCLMALTATTQETHSMKWTVRIALYYVLTALIMATIAYHVGLVIF